MATLRADGAAARSAWTEVELDEAELHLGEHGGCAQGAGPAARRPGRDPLADGRPAGGRREQLGRGGQGRRPGGRGGVRRRRAPVPRRRRRGRPHRGSTATPAHRSGTGPWRAGAQRPERSPARPMPPRVAVDAVVVGAGHNGLVAATLLARAGWSVEVLERRAGRGRGGRERDDRPRLPARLGLGVLRRAAHQPGAAPSSGLDTPGAVGAHRHARRAALGPATGRPLCCARTVDATADGLGDDGEAWRDLVDWWHRLGAPLFDAVLGPVGDPLPLLRAARGLARPARSAVQTARTAARAGRGVRPARLPHRGRADAVRRQRHPRRRRRRRGRVARRRRCCWRWPRRCTGMPVPVGGAVAAGARRWSRPRRRRASSCAPASR